MNDATPHQSDMYDALGEITRHFDMFCKENSCPYSIVSDEPYLKAYVLDDKSHDQKMFDYLTPVAKNKNVHMEVNRENPSGIVYTFTMTALADGHWKVLSKNPKRIDLSIFANQDDARKVRAKKTMYQRKFSERLEQSLQDIIEDQYKHPTRSYSRKQSAYRSSFGKSKTFGGIKEEYRAPNIAGQMVPPQIERPTNIGIVSADRTSDAGAPKDGKSTKIKPYNKRLNAVDNPTTVKPPAQLENFLRRLNERLSSSDESERSIFTGTVVPDKMKQPANPLIPDQSRDVVPDDLASKKLSDPSGMNNADAAQDISFRAYGAQPTPNGPNGGSWPNQLGGPHGGPVTNVRVTNLRADKGPTVSSQSQTVPLPNNIPQRKFKRPNITTVPPVGECIITRPEDGYDLLQLVVAEIGMVTEVRKIVLADRTFLKACNGDLRLEYDEIIPTQSGKMTVYRKGKKEDEFDVNLQDQTVLDSVVSKVLKTT